VYAELKLGRQACMTLALKLSRQSFQVPSGIVMGSGELDVR